MFTLRKNFISYICLIPQINNKKAGGLYLKSVLLEMMMLRFSITLYFSHYNNVF